MKKVAACPNNTCRIRNPGSCILTSLCVASIAGNAIACPTPVKFAIGSCIVQLKTCHILIVTSSRHVAVIVANDIINFIVIVSRITVIRKSINGTIFRFPTCHHRYGLLQPKPNAIIRGLILFQLMRETCAWTRFDPNRVLKDRNWGKINQMKLWES